MATRGRPKRNAIDRINIAIDLKENRKFALLLEHSGLTEGQALLILWGLWQFTGSNYAFEGDCAFEQKETGDLEVTEWINPKLNPEDGPALRRACHYVGQSDTLVSLLKKAGFLGEDLTVVGWFENQPLAAKLLVKRKLGQLGGRKSVNKKTSERTKNTPLLDQSEPVNSVDNSNDTNPATSSRTGISDDSLGIKCGSLGISDTKNPTQSRSPKPEVRSPNPKEENNTPGVVAKSVERARDAATPVDTSPPTNGRGSEAYLDLMAFMGRLQEFITITENDVAGIINDLRKYPDQSNWESVFEQLNQMRVDKRLDKLRSPVGFVRKIIRGGAHDPP